MLRLPTVMFALAVLFLQLTTPADAAWKAGIAKTSITPDTYMAMSGYGGRDNPADGKLTDLWAKAAVLEDNAGNRGLVITLDLVGIDRKLSKEICDALQERFGLERSQIAICTSHTHTGPVVGLNLAPLHYLIQTPEQQTLIDQYAITLREKVIAVTGEALADLQPSQVRWGNGHATFAVNRRENKPYDKAPHWRTVGSLKGPIDHDVPVLAIHNEEGGLRGVVFGYACHSTTLSVTQWSGDYPGFAQIELEKLHPGCVAMFWAGCGADQNPLPRSSVELAQHYGRRLADAVDAVLLTTELLPIADQLATTYTEIDLPLGELPTKEQIETNTKSTNRYEAARAKMLLKQIEGGKALSATYPYPVQTWRLGDDIQFITLGGEVVVDYAIRLKAELSGTKTWVAGYSNDVMAYIPSRRVLVEGGYEGGGAMVYYGLPTVWAPEVENDIVVEVHNQLTPKQ
ncbi:MAG: neutral/alkaline non-lysosomal ceramidase N-terminal domain-containing protein [Planctomycetaceae bacterium]|nr:neutral/alkaline non-lysosomal ceramidase N-terminal domain-containing protein [Planctomycetales bacterium]MCB9921377.1 neutral/alkaline non-lysosomal ceramidase N-terminal domain-containing protein [Planctomycetaceae bacterium]